MVDLPVGLDEEPDRVTDLLTALVAEDADGAALGGVDHRGAGGDGGLRVHRHAWTLRVRLRTTPSQRWAVNREFNRRVKYCFDDNAVQSPITAYKVQGWLPPGAEHAMPPDGAERPIQQAAQ